MVYKVFKKQETAKSAPAEADVKYIGNDGSKAQAPLGAVGYPGASQVKAPMKLTAGEAFDGKSFTVKCVGDKNNPIDIELIKNQDQVDKYSKYIDIWYNGSWDDMEAKLAKEPNARDNRFLHPEIGGTFQHYGLEPIEGDYVTHDPKMIAYARENGLIKLNADGKECFVNCYEGQAGDVLPAYTTMGDEILETIGDFDRIKAVQCKDQKTVLLPPGTKVKPEGNENEKTVGIGDVVCCLVKKGKAKNDWFVKPVTEFLKTAKKDDSNAEFIDALQSYVDNKGGRAEWMQILQKYGN